LIRIAITPAACEAIERTLALGSVSFEHVADVGSRRP
jgi:hypothetical protein